MTKLTSVGYVLRGTLGSVRRSTMPAQLPRAAPDRRHASPTVYHAVNPHAAMRDTCRVYEYAVPLRNVSLCPHCPRSTPRRYATGAGTPAQQAPKRKSNAPLGPTRDSRAGRREPPAIARFAPTATGVSRSKRPWAAIGATHKKPPCTTRDWRAVLRSIRASQYR